MNLFENLALPFFQSFLLFLIAKIILDIKYNLRDYLIIFAIIIPSAFLYYFFGSFLLLFLLISCVIFLYLKVKLYSILAVLSSAILMFLSNFIGFFISIFLRFYISNTILVAISYTIFFSFISIILGYSFKFLFKRLKKTYLLVISIVLVSSFMILSTYSQIPKSSETTLKGYALIFISILLFFAIVIILITINTLREMRYKQSLEEIETYYEYTLQIESINNEMRKFRHDYVNILTTMSEYIRENDMDGLKTYFNDNIVPMKDNLQMNSIKINGTDNLKVRAIKGLVTTKILQAQEKNIPISIEVPELIDHIEMNTVDLSRIIGIIIDNAIEASEELEDALIRIAFINVETSVMFIVMNKCKEDMPKIHELFQDSFSTKGDNRGLGLTTLKDITDTTENVLLDTTIENGYFVQKVEIINNMP